jgi:hypothetical protein
MIAEGILMETQVNAQFLDEETILASLASMILRAPLLKEQQTIRGERDNPDVEARIKKYEREFTALQHRKLETNQRLMHAQNLDVPAIMVHVRSGKQAILKQALLECAKIVGAVQSVTIEEPDEIFRKAFTKTCKESVMAFINSFV